MGIREKLLMEGGPAQNRLPREAVTAPSQSAFKKHLDIYMDDFNF